MSEAKNEATVLIVDDEEIVRDFMTAVLEDLGAKIISASGGQEALDVLKGNGAIDLVILDLNMPKMDGLSTYQELRKLRPQIKVLLQSGYNEQDALEKFSNLAINGFLKKPYLVDEFCSKVKKALIQQGPMSL